MAEWPSVAERIGGRWAISLQGWLILSGIGTVGLTVSTPMTADAPAQRARRQQLRLVGHSRLR